MSADPLEVLTESQREVLAKFRQSVSDTLTTPDRDDYWLARWLKARDWNMSKAEPMLRNHLKFRQEMGADTILEDYTPPEVLTKCFPGGFFGEDRDGHPVWYDNFGNLDFRGLQRAASKEEILKYKVMHLELTTKVLNEFSAKKGRHIGSVSSIINLENLCYQRHYHLPSIAIFREILSMFEANYPERTRRIIVVNAPRAFPFAYNLVKPFIQEHTREKIVVLSSDYQDVLHRYIAPDQLPQVYGGLCCEPDAWCSDHINPGCDVPEQFFLTNLTKTSREEMERVVVDRRSCHTVECKVHEPGTTLSWEFVSTDHDIAFGCFISDGKKEKQVLPLKRRNSHMAPEYGAHTCELVGTYVFKFDNSYSWMRAKEIYYTLQQEPPVAEQPPEVSTVETDFLVNSPVLVQDSVSSTV